jgi:3-oxoadipate enol-lactonase
MQRSFATLGDGARLAYRLEGPREGAVLLLSNSLGTRLEMWDPQVDAFAARFRVLRYDSRGHGESEATPGAYSLDRLGRDALELLDVLGLERVHFCGLSLGGMIGQWLGFKAPERIHRMVLANTSPYMGPPSGWQQRIETVQREGMAAVAESSVSRWFTPGFAAGQPEAIRPIREALLANSAQGYAGCCAAIRDMDLRPTAQLVSPPALIIAGAQDPSTPPEISDALARAMPRPPRVVRLDAAHLSNVEQPEAFARAVLDFLQ